MTVVNSGYTSSRGASVTPSDSGSIEKFDALYIGGAGNVVITGMDGVDIPFNSVSAGSTLQQSGTQVKSTGTTATNIVAMRI